MNKLYYFISLLIIGIMLSGCRSEVLVKPAPTPVLKKVLTKTTGYISPNQSAFSHSETTTFDYNSNGKLSRVIYKLNDSIIDTRLYTYTKDTVYEVCKGEDFLRSNFANDTTYALIILDANGYISKRIHSVNKSWGVPDWTEIFLNNSNGNNTKYSCFGGIVSPSVLSSYDINFKYSNGNMVLIDKVDWVIDKSEFTYYTDKINTIYTDYYGDGMFGYGSIDYFAKENKNLIKTQLLTHSNGSETIHYTYEFDANNYVTKRIMTYGNGYVTWDKYTYQ